MVFSLTPRTTEQVPARSHLGFPAYSAHQNSSLQMGTRVWTIFNHNMRFPALESMLNVGKHGHDPRYTDLVLTQNLLV